ncbi:MAG: 3'(2'),5'-bisphosphate nucleotidase CysQ [Vicingaceae bacterium]
MNQSQLQKYLEIVCKISLEAGREILSIYDSDFAVEHKDDKSPLTAADKKAHLKIVEGLSASDFPILSEEGRTIPFDERKQWDYFWMVDPLDGTKEFVKRNGEFTVNIALIHKQKAILGVIYVPVKDQLYFGAEGLGAFKVETFSKTVIKSNFSNWMSSANKLPKNIDRPYTIVGSRSHMSPETEEFINDKKTEKGEVDIVSVGSSLKLCMVAEGVADDYPRFAPTMEWDTAAGQAIVEAMGGRVLNWKTKESMKYNRENLLNDWFLVSA